MKKELREKALYEIECKIKFLKSYHKDMQKYAYHNACGMVWGFYNLGLITLDEADSYISKFAEVIANA